MDVEQACNMSRRNRAAVTAAKECGCYFCLRSFPATDVAEWADMDEMTALCPHCGIDSVLPEVTDKETLVAANERWFCETSNVEVTGLAAASLPQGPCGLPGSTPATNGAP